ncbi:MAG TPA: hypothetical protein VFZ73_19500, partial [Gemmatimonadaceae bacterium]
AQWNVARFDEGRNRLYVTAGLDPAFVTSIGYARVIPVSGHAFQLAGDVGLATSRMDVRDFRARMELQSAILQWRSLHLAGRATFITRGTENSIYRGLNFGADFTGTAGVYRSGWFAAGEFGFDKAVVTHITHTDWYRTYYYPDAKDGWYLNAGGVFHYGLAGGVSLGGAELVGRLGLRRTEDFEDLTPPVYASLGLGFGF